MTIVEKDPLKKMNRIMEHNGHLIVPNHMTPEDGQKLILRYHSKPLADVVAEAHNKGFDDGRTMGVNEGVTNFVLWCEETNPNFSHLSAEEAIECFLLWMADKEKD